MEFILIMIAKYINIYFNYNIKFLIVIVKVVV